MKELGLATLGLYAKSENVLTWTGSTAFTWYQHFKNLFSRFPKNVLVFHFIRYTVFVPLLTLADLYML